MDNTVIPTVWHAGEQALQRQLGIAERMAAFGPKVIRDVLPEQHRAFYGQLPFLLLGTVAADGAPWATVLDGPPGFLHSPDATTLCVGRLPGPADPAGGGLADGAAVGLLGMDLNSRRRNRLNGAVTVMDDTGFTVRVHQAFGNCPQYIQSRTLVESGVRAAAPAAIHTAGLDAAGRAAVRAADTFFVASYVDSDARGRRAVDVSHRGGRPGFIRVDADVLTIPDFSGNRHFNTLGNLLVNPRAGLLFVDFSAGDLLQLTGTTELVLDGDEVAAFPGAERLWRLRVTAAVRRPAALGLRWRFGDYSPRLAGTGVWPAATG